jgi:hypothetical protein
VPVPDFFAHVQAANYDTERLVWKILASKFQRDIDAHSRASASNGNGADYTDNSRVPKWPGLRFSAGSNEFYALMGSINASVVAYVLAQHFPSSRIEGILLYAEQEDIAFEEPRYLLHLIFCTEQGWSMLSRALSKPSR